MTVAELLEALRTRGIQLRASGDKLTASAPPGAVTAELSAAIREHKAELLRLVGDAQPLEGRAGAAPMARAADQSRYPLSFTQRRAALVRTSTGMLPSAFRFTGPLDVATLHRTLEAMVARHAPMRTHFDLDSEEGLQAVAPEVEVALPVTDLEGVPEAEREAELRRLLSEQSRAPLDLSHALPFRFHLYRLSPTDHAIYAGFSPLIFDGWSFDIFWNDLRSGYVRLRRGEPWPEAPLPASYADFVAAQAERMREHGAALARFWKGFLGDELPELPLPTDFPRPPVASGRGGSIPFSLPPSLVQRLAEVSRERGMTPQMLMLGALFVWAARLGGQRDIVVATPVDARLHSSIEGMIGPVANIILLRFGVDLEESFASMLPRLRDVCLEAYDHQEYPLERLDVRSRPRAGERFAPAFQLEFSYQQVTGRGAEMGELTLSQIELESGAATNDVTVWVKDWGARIAGAVEYKAELFRRDTMEHWVACYEQLLDGLLRAPEKVLAEVGLLGEEARRVDGAERLAGAHLPPWAVDALGTASRDVRVVDARGERCPLGIAGRLEGGPTALRVVLREDGSLERVVAPAGVEAAAPASVEPPANAAEARVAALFEELLKVDSVGATQSYFDLGGNSLTAVRLFAELQAIYGVRLPLTTIVEASTPRALAALIDGRFEGRQGSLVELKAGGDRCLFLMHDGEGQTLLYRELAQRMPPEIAVYGLEPLGRGRLPIVHTSIPEMAAHYVSEIKARQPAGPYCVGGLCAGGLLAYEVTRQLREQGDEVAFLGLMEAGPPQAEKRQTIAERRAARFLRVLRNDGGEPAVRAARAAAARLRNVVVYEAGRLRGALEGRALLLLLRSVFREGKSWPEGLPVLTTHDVWRLVELDYVPRPLSDQKAVLYRAEHGLGADMAYRDFLADPYFGWRPLLGEELPAVDLTGGHFSMFRVPHVEKLAADVRARVADAYGLAPSSALGDDRPLASRP